MCVVLLCACAFRVAVGVGVGLLAGVGGCMGVGVRTGLPLRFSISWSLTGQHNPLCTLPPLHGHRRPCTGASTLAWAMQIPALRLYLRPIPLPPALALVAVR